MKEYQKELLASAGCVLGAALFIFGSGYLIHTVIHGGIL